MRLDHDEANLLQDACLLADVKLLDSLVDVGYVDASNIDRVEDALLEVMARTGIDEHGELTEFGKSLDDLVGKIRNHIILGERVCIDMLRS